MPPKNSNSDRQLKTSSPKSKSVASSSSSSSGLPWTYIILYLIQSIIATIFLVSLAIDWDVPFPEVWKLLDVLKEKASYFVSWPVFHQLFALEGFPKYFKFDIGMVFYTFRWKWLDNTASWAFADLWFSLIDPVQLWCIVEFTRVGMKFVWLIYFVQQFIALSIMWPLYLIYYLIVITKYYPDSKKPLPPVNNWNVIVGFLTALTLLIPRWWLRVVPIDNIWNDFWLMIFIMGPAFVPFLLIVTNFFGRASSEQFYDIFLAFLAGGEYGIQRASVTHAFWHYGWKGFIDGTFIADMIKTDMEKFLAYDFSVSIFSTFLLFTFLLRREGFSVTKTIFSLIGLALLAITLSPAFLIIGFRLLLIHSKKTTKTE